MDLRSIFVANGIGIFLLGMLLYASRAKILRHRTEDKIYSYMVVGVMAGCFMEAASYALDGRVFPGSRILNYIANTYLFSVNILLPFCVMVYVDLGLYDNTDRILKCYRPQIIIGCIMLSMTVLTLFVPISYYISEQNVYERRPFGYVYYFVILYFCLTSYFTTKRYEKENGARAFFNVNVFLIPILVGAALQFMFYGLSLAWIASAIGLVGLFMMQQNEMAYIDSLVDTYNRQYLNHILSAWISRGHSISGIMLDIDHFKYINDQFGHSEGDNALRMVTAILKSSRKNNELVFRFAGDEFIILKRTAAAEELESYVERVNSQLGAYNRGIHPYQINMSYGIGTIENGDIDAFMKQMDAKMYEMKESHHRVA